MSTLEIIATVLTVACVLLANFRSTWQYPIGILGTIAFFFVVWSAQLYANAGLQVFFTAVQFYGWWYWLRGRDGGKPPITRFEPLWHACLLTAFVSAAAGYFLNLYTDANMATVDALVFGFSVFAQFLLDRKKIETWFVWLGVNVMSVYLYFGAGLYLLAGLYTALAINCFIAYNMWYKEYKSA